MAFLTAPELRLPRGLVREHYPDLGSSFSYVHELICEANYLLAPILVRLPALYPRRV